ncbi:unnamed protein product [Notodromas monacha]|uniref:Uncharacterized protein n=1 Tax=Notodromas monacha TaxID=399045 RepID=A0A7R9BN90_9CRUS|nr:unnamed protein product [Notodromas monacha]CAG0917249.1 unnamed protein product [Notodromas monacha]
MHSPKVLNMESVAVYRLIQKDLKRADDGVNLITRNKFLASHLPVLIDTVKTRITTCMKRNKLTELCRILYKVEEDTKSAALPVSVDVPPVSAVSKINGGTDVSHKKYVCGPDPVDMGQLELFKLPASEPASEDPQNDSVTDVSHEKGDCGPDPVDLGQVQVSELPASEVPKNDSVTDVSHEKGDCGPDPVDLGQVQVLELPASEDPQNDSVTGDCGPDPVDVGQVQVLELPASEDPKNDSVTGIKRRLPSDDEDCTRCTAGMELVRFCYTQQLDYCSSNMLKLLLHASLTDSTLEGPNCERCEKLLDLVVNVEEMQTKGMQDEELYKIAMKTKKAIMVSMKCPPKKTARHDLKSLGPVATLLGRFAEVDEEGQFKHQPPKCKLCKSPVSVVQFASFMTWALKAHYKMHDLLKGKTADYNGVNNDWRSIMSSFVFDVGCTAWLRLERNKGRLSAWSIPMRCVPGALKSSDLKFPKATYKGSLSVEDITPEEKVTIALGKDKQLTECVMIACNACQDGSDMGLFIRVDDLDCLIQRMQMYCKNLARRSLVQKAGTPQEKRNLEPSGIIGKGIFYNILARLLFPADSCTGILKYSTYSGTNNKKRLNTSGSCDEDEEDNGKEVEESSFVTFQFDCMFGLSPDGIRSPFVPGLLRSILWEEIQKLKQHSSDKLEEVLKEVIRKDTSSFVNELYIGIVSFKKWIKTCYEKQMRTIIGNYMQEIGGVSKEYASFQIWLNDVYYQHYAIWPDVFAINAATELKAMKELGTLYLPESTVLHVRSEGKKMSIQCIGFRITCTYPDNIIVLRKLGKANTLKHFYPAILTDFGRHFKNEELFLKVKKFKTVKPAQHKWFSRDAQYPGFDCVGCYENLIHTWSWSWDPKKSKYSDIVAFDVDEDGKVTYNIREPAYEEAMPIFLAVTILDGGEEHKKYLENATTEEHLTKLWNDAERNRNAVFGTQSGPSNVFKTSTPKRSEDAVEVQSLYNTNPCSSFVQDHSIVGQSDTLEATVTPTALSRTLSNTSNVTFPGVCNSSNDEAFEEVVLRSFTITTDDRNNSDFQDSAASQELQDESSEVLYMDLLGPPPEFANEGAGQPGNARKNREPTIIRTLEERDQQVWTPIQDDAKRQDYDYKPLNLEKRRINENLRISSEQDRSTPHIFLTLLQNMLRNLTIFAERPAIGYLWEIPEMGIPRLDPPLYYENMN